MQWHVHDNLCWTLDDDGKPKVAGHAPTTPATARPARSTPAARNPMVHVWIAPHECGPFAALEGHGAGQTAATGATGRPVRDARPRRQPRRRSTPTVAYDPTKPIDLSGVAGRDPGAAGVRREPRRRARSSSCRSGPIRRSPRPPASTRSATPARATSTTSSGTGSTTTCALDPDHPESLVYEPRARRDEDARVGDVHAPERRTPSTTCPTWAGR